MWRRIAVVLALTLAGSFGGPRALHAGSLDDDVSAPSTRPRTLFESILGSAWRREGEESSGERHLDPDRPHFPEASTTVGLGHAVLEGGYTYMQRGSSVTQTYPEALLRVGMFAEWFEFRIGQSFIDRDRESGRQDLYLGVKVQLIDQKDFVPQIAIIPQLTVPTGGGATAGRVLPGVNIDCGWEVVKDFFNVELLIATNRVADTSRESHVEVATGLTGAFAVRRNLELFVEWDAFYPVGSDTPTGARHYAVGGAGFFIPKDIAVDVRAGVGLNRDANDFLAGTGFAVRY